MARDSCSLRWVRHQLAHQHHQQSRHQHLRQGGPTRGAHARVKSEKFEPRDQLLVFGEAMRDVRLDVIAQ